MRNLRTTKNKCHGLIPERNCLTMGLLKQRQPACCYESMEINSGLRFLNIV